MDVFAYEEPWDRMEPVVSRLSSLKRSVRAKAQTLHNLHFIHCQYPLVDIAPL